LALYSASKAFVYSFSCALSVELEGSGVTVTALCPGGTKTEFQQRAGMEHARVFNSPFFQPMSARSVAEIGCDAMMKGKASVVAGLKNKIMVAVSRRVPALWSARVAARLNRNR
jgi:short-subunit dehydrogenase